MGDENPRRTLGDYSRPSHEGYRNTIEVPNGNDLVPLRSDTIRLVQNRCLFNGLRSKDSNQHLKVFLKIVDSIDLNVETMERTRLRLFKFSLRDQASNWLKHLLAGSISTWEDLTTLPRHGIDLWLQIQIFYDHGNPITRRTIDQAAGGKICDKNNEESWALLEDLALYDNENWNDPRDFAKPVNAISMPQDVLSTSDRRLIELKNQVQRMMEDDLNLLLHENPRRTLGDYSRPSHEGYRNTIEVPNGNDLVPLRSDTIRLVQNRCLFNGLRSKDSNQHLKVFLKIVDSIDLNVETMERTRLRLFKFSLRDQASNWLKHLLAGSISTWEDLTTRVLAQFFPPGRTSKL
nr:MAK10-like protein [Tanacetum cinerariifolium]